MRMLPESARRAHRVFALLSIDRSCTQIYLLTKEEGGREKPLTDKFHIHMFSKTWDCSIVGTFKGGKEMMMPGENGVVRTFAALLTDYSVSLIVMPFRSYRIRQWRASCTYSIKLVYGLHSRGCRLQPGRAECGPGPGRIFLKPGWPGPPGLAGPSRTIS